jgi:tRNA-guanine family transglycosylase
LKFTLTDNDRKARAGTLTTDHGTIETPVFMPVGFSGFQSGKPDEDKGRGSSFPVASGWNEVLFYA